jgi:hypothetical protein
LADHIVFVWLWEELKKRERGEKEYEKIEINEKFVVFDSFHGYKIKKRELKWFNKLTKKNFYLKTSHFFLIIIYQKNPS